MTHPTSRSLFDDGLGKDYSLVEVLSHGKPKTPAQQHFQRLVAKIERVREQMKQWQTYALRYQQRMAGEVEPLRWQLRLERRQMIALLDKLLSQTASARRLGRAQRAKLLQMLTDLLAELPQDSADEALVALRDKYSVPQYCVEQSEREMQLTCSMLKDVFGLDVGRITVHAAPKSCCSTRNARCRSTSRHKRAARRQSDTSVRPRAPRHEQPNRMRHSLDTSRPPERSANPCAKFTASS